MNWTKELTCPSTVNCVFSETKQTTVTLNMIVRLNGVSPNYMIDAIKSATVTIDCSDPTHIMSFYKLLVVQGKKEKVIDSGKNKWVKNFFDSDNVEIGFLPQTPTVMTVTHQGHVVEDERIENAVNKMLQINMFDNSLYNVELPMPDIVFEKPFADHFAARERISKETQNRKGYFFTAVIYRTRNSDDWWLAFFGNTKNNSILIKNPDGIGDVQELRVADCICPFK